MIIVQDTGNPFPLFKASAKVLARDAARDISLSCHIWASLWGRRRRTGHPSCSTVRLLPELHCTLKLSSYPCMYPGIPVLLMCSLACCSVCVHPVPRTALSPILTTFHTCSTLLPTCEGYAGHRDFERE